MYYEQDEIESKLTCRNCGNRYNIPKLLPCGETICETCLNQLIENKQIIQCPFCKLDIQVPADNLFPTQKLLVELLNIKPIKIYRGSIYEGIQELLKINNKLIDDFFNDLNNYECVVRKHCKKLRDDIEVRLTTAETYDEKQSILLEVNLYEEKCLENLNKKSVQKDEVVRLFQEYKCKLNKWLTEINKTIFNDDDLRFIYESAKMMKNVIKNSIEFYKSLQFLGKVLEYKPSGGNDCDVKYYLQYKDFQYSDILNIDQLKLHYNTNAIDFNAICSSLVNQTIHGMWLSLFTNDSLALCFYIYDMNLMQFRIIMKLMDNNGQLLKANEDSVNCELITMATSTKYVILGVRNLLSKQCQLHLYDLYLNNVKSMTIDYEPLLIHHTECYIYVLSNKTPFVHVHNWSLEEKYSFGQDVNSNEAFYMPNVIQIYVRNEKLYIRDSENIYIKVLTLNNGNLIKLININLLDCLLHIDSIGRIIVINQDSKILFIFNEDAQILFEYDLTFIHSISSFCIGHSGNLLINDAQKKILHIS